MFEEPEESPEERPFDPAVRAREKADEFRMHAELAAVFEGYRKFDAAIVPGLDAELARSVQKRMAGLEKSRSPDSPLLPEESMAGAAEVLGFFKAHGLSTSDYHIYRRPGEVMIVRWLAGEQVGTFYERFQAHFDAVLTHFREEERQAQEWKQEPATLAYLDALDGLKVNLAERYLREVIREHRIYVLSTQTADEMDILHLCDYVMGVPAAQVVGAASAPPEEPTEADRAWFFKLFSLRGMGEGQERMCFFTYLQKTDEGW
jgi:hypothetical protein